MTAHNDPTPQLNIEKIRREAFARRRQLVKKGEVISAEAFCKLLGINPKTLEEGVKASRFIELELDGQIYYPKFYAHPKASRFEIEEVAVVLAPLAPWDRRLFFTNPKYSLEMNPLDALSQGKFKEVMVAARGHIER